MRKFSGYDYTKINVANTFGLDMLDWDDRLKWVDDHQGKLWDKVDEAKEPYLYIKALNTLESANNGEATGSLMSLDATASGLQIMACLIGCVSTARNTNLITTGHREDAYKAMAERMNNKYGTDIDRPTIKYPTMTLFYGSIKQPEKVFGEGSKELRAFYQIVNKELSGAVEVMADVQSCWQSGNRYHRWTLPDGHVAKVLVTDIVDKKIEVNELMGATFTFRAEVVTPTEHGISLIANIIHSIDAYVVREMVRRAHKQGFELLAVHDSFWAHPNHMNKVRQNYLDILMEIADSDLLQDILREITGNDKLVYKKRMNNMSQYMRDAEYSLS